MKQLSDCCKAEIKLTGSPEHKDAFACAKCGRIIGTPIKKQKPKELDKEINRILTEVIYSEDIDRGYDAFKKLFTQQRTELFKDLIKIADNGEFEDMRREVTIYFKGKDED